MKRLALLFVGLGLLIAGCGQLPRPFQPADKTANALLDPKAVAGVLVLPLAHDRPGAPEAAAEALASALRARNVAASTRGWNAASRILTGRATIQSLPDGKEELLLFWELADAKGGRLDHFAQRSELTPGAWQTGDPTSIAAVMDQAAVQIAAVVQGPRPGAALSPAHPRGRLAIQPMTGLPGDGAQSLAEALRRQLLAAGLPVAERPGADDLLVTCAVILGQPLGPWQEVTVVWTVSRVRDGGELGQITQQNRVPAGRLDGPWGTISTGIAEGAAHGIIQVLERVAQSI